MCIRDRLGTQSENAHVVPRPLKDIKREIREKTTSRWNARWRSEPTCRQTRLMLPECNLILTQFMFNQNRVNSSLLTQFITGHNYLKYHRSLADPSVGRSCRLCDDGTEDSWHLLTKCEALAMHGYATFLGNNIRKLPHPKLVLQLSLIHI